MSEGIPPPSDPIAGSPALARAVRAMLRPLVRLMLQKQLTYPFLANLLKSVIVEVAETQFIIEGRRQTDSRISLLTGIHRKDVKRLRRELVEEEPIASAVTLGALLVSRWLADPDFLDTGGRPRPLPRMGEADEGPFFETLVASVSRDIPARSVLDEWLRLGVAEFDERGRVRLRVESFVPERGLEEKIHFFGRNLHDHIAAGVHNILAEGPPFLDRSVFYDQLTASSVEALSEFARSEGADILRRVNRRARELQTADAGAANTNHRMTFGAYYLGAATRGEPGGSLQGEDPDGE